MRQLDSCLFTKIGRDHTCRQFCNYQGRRRAAIFVDTRNAQDRAKNVQTVRLVSTAGHFISNSIDHPLVREFVPNVIEPSFGIGRILYALLEHSYWSRKEDVDRGVGRFLTSRPKRFSSCFGVILGSLLAALGCPDKGVDCPTQRERGIRSAYSGSL